MVGIESFELKEDVITREFLPPKPSPAGILHIASQWGSRIRKQFDHGR